MEEKINYIIAKLEKLDREINLLLLGIKGLDSKLKALEEKRK